MKHPSFESFLGVLFIVLGVLMITAAPSAASGGQNPQIKNSSSQNASSGGPLSSPTWPNSHEPLAGAAITPESGTLSDGVYSSSYFNFSYRLPPQWQSGGPFAASGEEYRQEPGDTRHDEKKYLLLDARGGNNSVEVVALDTSQEPSITPGDVVVAEMGALRSLGGKMIGAAAEKEIRGRTFSIGKAQVNGEVRGANETLYVGFAAVKQGSYILTWTFFADSPSRLQELLGTLETVSFEK